MQKYHDLSQLDKDAECYEIWTCDECSVFGVRVNVIKEMSI